MNPANGERIGFREACPEDAGAIKAHLGQVGAESVF